ncbi:MULTISPECIES: hypothetical protein [Burkholderia]|uniref:hypothetical protein n=1 Tax=Burkholderia TaxID=32008 RepID=UPI001CF361AB|nr:MULTISPECIES: hypothetical protein [Burkholderia]MCA7985173.1 hypothetical protein [Burkholderia vietnamiensis]UEP42745.1 hypothetical protein LMA02_07265 [Burkholderia sp. B21-005]
MFKISVADDIAKIRKSLTDLEKRQLPFATANALTALAKNAQAAEKEAMPEVFDRPTPFTVNSVAVRGARKSNLEARVFIKDIAAAYLEPFEFGGNHKLLGSGRTWLNPKDKTQLNQYGNFSKTALKRLQARPDIFIGNIKTSSGETIGGVWRRPPSARVTKVKGKRGSVVQGSPRGHLKLLVRFGDARPVKQHLEFGERAFEVVNDTFEREFEVAMNQAIATAKL